MLKHSDGQKGNA